MAVNDVHILLFLCSHNNIDGLVQDCSYAITNAPELLQSCTKPSICSNRCSTRGIVIVLGFILLTVFTDLQTFWTEMVIVGLQLSFEWRFENLWEDAHHHTYLTIRLQIYFKGSQTSASRWSLYQQIFQTVLHDSDLVYLLVCCSPPSVVDPVKYQPINRTIQCEVSTHSDICHTTAGVLVISAYMLH